MKKQFKLQNVTIGSDLEIFLKDKNTGEITSGIGIIGGTKKEPKSIGNFCFIQEDNILAEANIPPVIELKDFINCITYIKNYITDNYPQFELHYVSSAEAPIEVLLNDKAREFGCEPVNIVDYNNDGDTIPDNEFDQQITEKRLSPLRTGGFHIHFGYDNPNIETNRDLVKLFEKNVTLPLLKYDIDDYHRRSSYGKSGEYREKEYGVECRSLGTALLRDDVILMKVWDGIQKTILEYNQGERVSKQEFKIIQEIINTHK